MGDITDDLVKVYADSDALAQADLVRRGEVSALELVETAIHLVEQIDPKLNAVVLRTFDLARATAAEPGEGPFAGVPFLLKNLGSMWKGTPLTFGLAYTKDFVCDTDSEMSRRMRAAGLAVIGRSNTPEYGWSITTEPRLYGPTINPWNPSVTAGGSSGGAAAAVAARIVPIAEASDGGGSIRVPASCCGVVGLKPSRGRVTYGPDDADIWFGSIYALCNARTVRDTAAFLDAVAGTVPGDPYNPPRPERSWSALLADRPRKLRIGFTLTAPWGEPFAPDVKAAVLDAARLFESLGHDVEEYAFKLDLEAAWWRYNDIIAVETAGEFDRLAEAVGRPVGEADLAPFNWSMLRHAATLSATHYSASIAAIRKAGQQIALELAPFDVFVTPTLTQTPRPPGYWSMEDGDRERYLARWSDAAFMFTFNISGCPPCRCRWR
ncbi:amidase [Labrys monachus]|uniref:Indoleacetamide hydrolase n=1 Tax=Labrys monachus TaxID=217067 RepID=A0ABU0F8R7_9HYPH|nr:amidase [Labrys monachus]MDQ0391015.1 amidase [Labrys monachus]